MTWRLRQPTGLGNGEKAYYNWYSQSELPADVNDTNDHLFEPCDTVCSVRAAVILTPAVDLP